MENNNNKIKEYWEEFQGLKEFWEAFLELDADKVGRFIKNDPSFATAQNLFTDKEERPLDRLYIADISPTGFPESVHEKRARIRDGKKFDPIESGVYDAQKEASRQIIRMLLENGATNSSEKSLEDSFDERFPNTR